MRVLTNREVHWVSGALFGNAMSGSMETIRKMQERVREQDDPAFVDGLLPPIGPVDVGPTPGNGGGGSGGGSGGGGGGTGGRFYCDQTGCHIT
jgi:hypothetical protein